MNKIAISLAAAFCAIASAAFPSVAQAEDCRLVSRGVISFQNTDGELTIPVTISGKTYQFSVELGTTFSAIDPKLADDMHLPKKDMPAGIEIYAGSGRVRQRVTLPDILIGASQGKDFEMLELPSRGNGAVAGVIGMDLLSHFDLELDLKANTMRLFSQDHCLGEVVYWAKTYGVVPLERSADGGVYLDGKLDEKKVSIAFNIEQNEAGMGISDARDLFGFLKDDPRLSPVGRAEDHAFRYPFAKLAFGDLAINSPAVTLYAQTPDQQCRLAPKDILLPEPEAFATYGGRRCIGAMSRLTVGYNVLKQLRLYFAFKEEMLYLTPASPSMEDLAPEMSILKNRASH